MAKRSLIVFVTIAAGLAAFAIVSGLRDRPAQLLGSTHTPPRQVQDARLNDVSTSDGGPLVGVVAPPGELKLVYFGFTSCPDICPTTLADLGRAISTLPTTDRRRVTVALVSIDPKRDSGETMRSYLSHFFEDSPAQALRTDDAKLLAKAQRSFGASHKLGKPKRDGSYDVSHTAFVYAVGEDGTVEVEWPFGMRAEDIAHDLKILLDD